MYYVPWCPACEKPEPRLVHVLNLIQALRHLEISGHTGIEARVCDALIEGGMLINDTCVMLALPAEGQGIEDEHTKDLLVLRQVFGLGDCVMVEISW